MGIWLNCGMEAWNRDGDNFIDLFPLDKAINQKLVTKE
jgi:hypothetical protein